jgi:hypothetical protein
MTAMQTHAMSDPLQPFSIMTLAQACIVRKTPVQLTSSTWSHRASVADQPFNTHEETDGMI